MIHPDLLFDADRIVATDLYPARCRTVIASLASALREQSLDLAESREYGVALVQEIADMAAKTDALLALANSMDADFEASSADVAESELAGALNAIIHMGHDCPATFYGTEAEWEARRARMMQDIARAALARARGEAK